VVRRAKIEPLLRPFKGSGRIRERGSDAWFPVEFLTYHDDRNRLRSFAYVQREDGGDLPDGHYVFLDELGEHSFRWRKWKGKVAFRVGLSGKISASFPAGDDDYYRDLSPIDKRVRAYNRDE
jgi:hypothetical protein